MNIKSYKHKKLFLHYFQSLSELLFKLLLYMHILHLNTNRFKYDFFFFCIFKNHSNQLGNKSFDNFKLFELYFHLNFIFTWILFLFDFYLYLNFIFIWILLLFGILFEHLIFSTYFGAFQSWIRNHLFFCSLLYSYKRKVESEISALFAKVNKNLTRRWESFLVL